MAITERDVMSLLPKGIILPFHADPSICLPWGWAICNGENGTPNLEGRFLRGVSSEKELGKPDGAETHFHAKVIKNGVLDGAGWDGKSDHCQLGKTTPASNLPPYYQVIYIMKIK